MPRKIVTTVKKIPATTGDKNKILKYFHPSNGQSEVRKQYEGTTQRLKCHVLSSKFIGGNSTTESVRDAPSNETSAVDKENSLTANSGISTDLSTNTGVQSVPSISVLPSIVISGTSTDSSIRLPEYIANSNLSSKTNETTSAAEKITPTHTITSSEMPLNENQNGLVAAALETQPNENVKSLEKHQTNYKRKCVELSCVISKKSVKIGNLENENNALKMVVQGLNTDMVYALEEDDLKELADLPQEEYADMKFVRLALLKVYKNDSGLLKAKSLKGCKPRRYARKDGTVVQNERKQPLTPTKVEQLRIMYGKRVGFEGHRFKSFNKHIINSLNKVHQRHERNSKAPIAL
jgi:hypothetical protein